MKNSLFGRDLITTQDWTVEEVTRLLEAISAPRARNPGPAS